MSIVIVRADKERKKDLKVSVEFKRDFTLNIFGYEAKYYLAPIKRKQVRNNSKKKVTKRKVKK